MERGPEKLGDILGRLFVAKGWGRTTERQRLDDAWTTVAGAEYAGRSRVIALKRGTLEVEVAGGALLQELASFHKRRLLDAMKSALPGTFVKELRFRAK